MPAVLQISDTHFGTEQAPVVAALLDLARALGPEVVVFSGDVTQRARAAQFAAAAEFVKQLGAPRVLTIPGNHDIPLFNVLARVRAPYAGFVRAFGPELEPQYSSESLLVACINTTRPRRHKDGEISNAQIERVAALARQARPKQLRIAVVHQPVHVIRTHDLENLLHGYEAAVRTWAGAGIDIVMGGHIHLPYVRALNERITGLPRRIWAVQAGTAVSSRVRYEAPNSVNVLRYEPEARDELGQRRCLVEQWNYVASAQAFRCKETTELHLER